MDSPSESTLKARRREIPHFDDEPIQWHRNSTKHDKCPWCGLKEMIYYSKTRRECDSCCVTLDITEMFKSGKAWYEEKLYGYHSDYGGDPGFEIVEPDEGFDLMTAQRASGTKRAKLTVEFGSDVMPIFWHRAGHVPERDDGKRIMAAGSDFWHWVQKLRLSKVWEPDDPLNAMEVLARAATDDPVFAVVLSP